MKKKFQRVDTSKDTVNSKAYTDRVNKVGQTAPTSAMYLNNAPVKAAVDHLLVDGPLVVAAEAQVLKDEAQAAKSRGARDVLVAALAGTYSIAVATVEKYATTPADVASCGFDALARARYAVLPPTDVIVGFNKLKEHFDILIKHSPGMHAAQVEISTDPIGAATWKRLDGIAAEYHLSGYAPGTYWVRARSVRGAEVSDWTPVVSVIVK